MKFSVCVFFASLLLSAQPGDTYEYGGQNLTPAQQSGRNTWYFWTGGGENLWRAVAGITHGITDLVQFVDARHRPHRFRDMGVINDPDCTAPTGPDEFGMLMDSCRVVEIPGIPGTSTGIVGLRRFPNPKFDRAKWNYEAYLADPAKVEPPFIVGMTCGFCHIGFHPHYPPSDPEQPSWRNLAPAIGNQYLKEASVFTLKMTSKDFRWHVGTQQPAGTSDTSRFATDHMFNPNAINSIVHLAHRPVHAEKMADGSTRNVHHILKEGADSVGTAGASLRVYVNIGMCSEYWLSLHDPVAGISKPQAVFDIEKARRECDMWRQTEARMADAEDFLKTIPPYRLADNPVGAAQLSKDAALLQRGAAAFAAKCASCHSSKQPPPGTADKVAWFAQAVQQADFTENNFLSDDQRYSVSVLGTNIARAMATNAIRGSVWEQFSSETYKQLPAAGELKGLYNPVSPNKPINFQPPGGGRGYYRTPTLAGVWATAPYLHNNSLGLYNADPSIAGRIAAYQDAMEKMLWPGKRDGIRSMPVTSIDSELPITGARPLKVPKGMPVNLLARLNVPELRTLRSDNLLSRIIGGLIGRGRLKNSLLRRSLAPDFIEDRGHTFGEDLSDADKKALIEYVKTL
jgi:hypothetical protein